MAQIVQLKRNTVAGQIPTTSSLVMGELAMNTYDGRIFFKRSGSAITIESLLSPSINSSYPIWNTGSLYLNGSIIALNNISATGSIDSIGGYKYNGTNVIRADINLKNYFFANGGNLTATGNFNISIGSGSQLNLTTGTGNINLGHFSLVNNDEGSNNLALGNGTLRFNTFGEGNISIGNDTLRTNTEGSYNIGLGLSSLYLNTVGNYNVALGYNALYVNTEGSSNIAIGKQSLRYNTYGGYNIALGEQSLYSNTEGLNNIAIGHYALMNNTDGSNNIVIGYNSLLNFTGGSNNTIIGDNSSTNLLVGSYNTFIGKINNEPTQLNNHVIIADGQGNRRITVNSSGSVHLSGSLTLSSSLSVSNGGTGTGSFSLNYLLKGNGTGSLQRSQIVDNGTNVYITGSLVASAGSFVVSRGYGIDLTNSMQSYLTSDASTNVKLGSSGHIAFLAGGAGTTEYGRITNDGKFLWKTTSSNYDFDVSGSGRFSNSLYITGSIGVGISPTASIHITGSGKFQIGTPDISSTNGIGFEITSNIPQIRFRNSGNYTIALRQNGYELESYNFSGAARGGIISSYIKTSTIIDENNYYNATLNSGKMTIGGYGYADTPLVVRGTSFAYPFDITTFQNSGSVNLVRILYDGRMTVAGGTDNGYGLEVTGTAKVSGNLTTNITSSLLKTTSGGIITSAVAGTDYIAGGVGTANYVAKFSGSGVLVNSLLQDNGTKVSLSGSTNVESFNNTGATNLSGLNISSDNIIISSIAGLELQYSSGVGLITAFNRTGGVYLPLNFRATDLTITSNGTASHRFFSGGNFSVGSVIDSGYKLDVNGTSAFRGEVTYIGTTPSQSFYTTEKSYNGNAIKFVVGSTSAVDWSGGYLKIQSHHTNSSTFNDTIVVKGANVGIGNTSPSYSLDVTGTGRFTSTLNVITSGTQSTSQSLFKINADAGFGAIDLFQVFANGDFQFKNRFGANLIKFLGAEDYINATTTGIRAINFTASGTIYSPLYGGNGYQTRTLNFDNSTGALLTSTTASDKILQIKGAVSQSANLTEWQNSAGTALVSVASNGALTTTDMNMGGVMTITNAGYFIGSPSFGIRFNNSSNTQNNVIINESTPTYFRLGINTDVALTVPNGGTGASSFTANYLLKGNGTSAVAPSQIYNDGTFIGFNQITNTHSASHIFRSATNNQVVLINDTGSVSHTRLLLKELSNSVDLDVYIYASEAIIGTATNHPLLLQTNATTRAKIFANGRWGINTTTDSGYQFDVNGTGRFVGALTLSTALTVPNGGTGLTSLAADFIPFGNGTGALRSSSALQWNDANGEFRVYGTVNNKGIGTTNTVYNGVLSFGSGLNFIGTNGYWAFRTGTVYDFNIDVYNSNSPFSAFKINQSGVVSIANTTASTTPTTGALIVSGGLGVGGNINAADITGVNISATNRFISANYVSSDNGSTHKINLSSNITAFTNNNVEIARITSSGFYIGTTATTDNLYSVKSIIIPDFSTANNAGVFITNNRAFSAGGAFLAIYNAQVTDTQGTGTIPKSAIRSAVEFSVSSNIGNTQSTTNAHNFTVLQKANDLNYLNSQFTYNITGYTNSGTQQINVQSYFYIQGTANATTAYGFRSRGQFATTGSSITTLYDFVTDDFVNAPSGGTISNRYGLYLNNTNTGVTNSWGVYQTSANTNNYFAGKVGIGVTPTATLHLKAGTATANTAPLKFTTSGSVLLTTPEAGVMEVDSSGSLYFTPVSTRKTIAFTDSVITGTVASLTTGRTISITGDLSYTSPAFDGSGNVTAAGTLATVNSNVGTFGSTTQVGVFTVNAKGLITSASNATIDLSAYLTSATAASTYQPLNSNLTTIAGLTATTNNFIVSVGGAWASRTPTQVKATLAITNTDVSGLGTLATQNGTFSGTSSGTNTGDNAVNTLYSGLVTNATHTGDATGSGSLTVVGINGTLLSGLATGILKNTTSTGVPSIAVQSDITALLGAGSITNTMLVNGAVANLSGTNTGDQTITLTGAVTGSGTGSFATTLASAIVGISNLSATGTPSSTTYLRGDNTWATVSGGSFNGSGVNNYIAKFSGSVYATSSLIYDNGTNVGIGNTNSIYNLDVTGTGRFTSNLSITGSVLTNSIVTNSGIVISAISSSAFIQLLTSQSLGFKIGSYSTYPNNSIIWGAGVTPALTNFAFSVNDTATDTTINTTTSGSIYMAADASDIFAIFRRNNTLIRRLLVSNKDDDGGVGDYQLKISPSSAVLTTPEDGVLEYEGTHLYFTIGSTRYQIDQQGGSIGDGDKGDITVSSSGTVWTIDSGSVTLAKMANMATTSLIGRSTAGTGVPEVLSASTAKTLLSLNNVENTALSTWTGSINISTVGTITSGSWSGSTIAVNKGGTNITSYAVGDLIYASASTTLSKLAAVSSGQFLKSAGVTTAPVWGTISESDLPNQAGIAWTTYSDTITWNGTPPSGTAFHEYRYYRIGKMVFGFIRIRHNVAGANNTTLTLKTNSFPPISVPSDASTYTDYITSCTGILDTADSGSPPATRCWIEFANETSNFVIKFIAGTQSAKFAMCSFTYLTA